MKALVNIFLFYGIFQVEIYVNNYNGLERKDSLIYRIARDMDSIHEAGTIHR